MPVVKFTLATLSVQPRKRAAAGLEKKKKIENTIDESSLEPRV